MPHTPAYTEKCKPCLLCGMFGARSSSDTDHDISRKENASLLCVRGGVDGDASAVQDGGIA